MSKSARLPALGVTLMLGVALATGTVTAQLYDEIADAQNDLARLARLYADARKNGRKLDEAAANKMAQAMKNKYADLNALMAVYKPSEKKGAGFDPQKKGKGDGIEKRLIDLGNPARKPISKAQLAREKELLLRVAMVNLAIHEASRHYGPQLKGGNQAKKWNKYNGEMKEGTEDLIKAANANDPTGLKNAAGKINVACNDCHSEFR